MKINTITPKKKVIKLGAKNKLFSKRNNKRRRGKAIITASQ
jgi:hypothetical protein